MELRKLMTNGVPMALLAAALFGASTPLAKLLVGELPPLLLAGVLYLGSGLGLSIWYAIRRLIARAAPHDRLRRRDVPWLAGAIVAGGIIGPALLMIGLVNTTAATASLLLNMEGVLTALLAWFVFRENFDARIALGMGLIVVAGLLLSWQEAAAADAATGAPWGALAIVGACLAWAIDNNLTRKVSASDAVQIACWKGLTAGTVNVAIALLIGNRASSGTVLVGAASVGFFGYGLSLVLFVVALRNLGTARTGAYFSIAPFFGAALSLLLFSGVPGPLFWIAAFLMLAGIWLHVSEDHAHEHTHQPTSHAHEHTHDAHHLHAHDVEWDGKQPHAHTHRHDELPHAHGHYPDIHHRHEHGRGH